jgi:hypothetical protein
VNHLFVGALIPFLVALGWYLRRGYRASVCLLVVAPVAMFLGATWAVLPDLPRTFGFGEFRHEIAMNPAIDIFFWHYTINQHEHPSPWFSVGMVAMVAALLAAAWRELRLLEKP